MPVFCEGKKKKFSTRKDNRQQEKGFFLFACVGLTLNFNPKLGRHEKNRGRDGPSGPNSAKFSRDGPSRLEIPYQKIDTVRIDKKLEIKYE